MKSSTPNLKRIHPMQDKAEPQVAIATPTFQLIPIDQIDDPQLAMRSDLTEESLTDLVLSIKQMGIIEPIIVTPRGERFEVIAGHRRLKAARLATLPSLPAIVKKLGDEEAEMMKIHENLYRADVSPTDEAIYFDHLIKDFKISPSKIAQLIGKSPSYVSDRLAIFNYPPLLRKTLEDKLITFSVARTFARLEDPDKITTFVRYAVANGMTPSTAEKWVKDEQRAREDQPVATTEPGTFMSQGVPEEPYYKCCFCEEGIDIIDLRPLYAHDACDQSFKKALKGGQET